MMLLMGVRATMRTRNLLVFACVAAILTLQVMPHSAAAIEVKKSLYSGGGGGGGSAGPTPKNPLTPAVRQALQQTVSDDTDKFLAEEDGKKNDGKPYVDLYAAKMKYMPSTEKGVTSCTVRLEAPEYKPSKDPTSKGIKTGVTKTLVLKYKLDGQKWAQTAEPAWEDASAKGGEAAKAAN
jgi:hypothetical protein